MSTENKQRIVVVGAGWAGLGATYHLAKQGYNVTLLEASAYPGGLVAGWKTAQGRSVEGGIHGFWYPYRNIIDIPLPSNACFGFDPTTGWTFFDLNTLHDEYKNEPGSVIEVDFYHANQLLTQSDEQIINKICQDLEVCIPGFLNAQVTDSSIIRVRQGVTHFAPGSYQYLLPANTSIPNLYMSGDWIINNHGSWSQEKAYVTGLEAANLVIQQFGAGKKASIIPVEADELHIRLARKLNQTVRDGLKFFLPNFWLT